MKLLLDLPTLTDEIRDAIVEGLAMDQITPSTVGGKNGVSLAAMNGHDARLKWATERARNIAQALCAYEIEEGA